jgi:hypothetical protein
MPTPQDAAKILRAHFGFAPNPDDSPDDPSGVGDPTGAVALAGLRGTERRELEDRLANDAFAATAPGEGFVPGEPGRRYVNRLPAANLASDATRLNLLREDQAGDPFTGDAAAARTQRVQNALDDAATIQRPEIGDAKDTLAKQNYFAEFMKNKGMKFGEKMGEYEAGASPEAYAAAMTPVRVAGSSEAQANADAASQRAMAVEGAKGSGKGTKYTAAEQALLDSAGNVQGLGPQLLQMLEAEHPGIAENPKQYGQWTDAIGAHLIGKVYRYGKLQSGNSDTINQLTGFLEAAVPRMLATGRLNQQQYEDLKLHAPALGLSDGANYERTKYILEHIMPSTLAGIDKAHSQNPTALTLPNAAGANPMTTEPTPDDYALGGSMSEADMIRRAQAQGVRRQ